MLSITNLLESRDAIFSEFDKEIPSKVMEKLEMGVNQSANVPSSSKIQYDIKEYTALLKINRKYRPKIKELLRLYIEYEGVLDA